MEEIAFVSLNEDQVPESLEVLKEKLIAAGLDGNYSIIEFTLRLKNEDGIYQFELADAIEDEFLNIGPGIDVAGDFEDVAATIIDLQEVFEEAFPGCEFSHAYE